jgi:stage II sporulation protein R
LRIHIRADSDETGAQAVKYAVRDAVVDYLTPVAAKAQNFSQAAVLLESELAAVEGVANAVLRGQGFDYRANATLQTERFPTRKYGEFVLEEGEYLALIVKLGRGEGQNWWCVIYPPLCFAGQQNIVYKSKILELIERWKGG